MVIFVKIDLANSIPLSLCFAAPHLYRVVFLVSRRQRVVKKSKMKITSPTAKKGIACWLIKEDKPIPRFIHVFFASDDYCISNNKSGEKHFYQSVSPLSSIDVWDSKNGHVKKNLTCSENERKDNHPRVITLMASVTCWHLPKSINGKGKAM